jgi:hypothetical protein
MHRYFTTYFTNYFTTYFTAYFTTYFTAYFTKPVRRSAWPKYIYLLLILPLLYIYY